MLKNKDLKVFYDGVYKKGERTHYSKFIDGGSMTEEKRKILGALSWKGKRVLDVGCGTGELAYLISKGGALEVTGVDYSAEAITIAKINYQGVNLNYQCQDINKIGDKFDVITLAGVLEHIDKPFVLLQRLVKMLHPKGSLDAHTEVAIKEALKSLKKTVTLIVITHKPSTIDYVDKIIALKDGKIVETGSPADLMERSDSYFKQIYDKGSALNSFT